MFDFTIPTSLTVEFVGDLEKMTDSRFSQGRVRVYYKHGNRNGTWVTEKFAEQLNKTITYIPIVATYNKDYEDFEDHNDGVAKKAYGFVPFEANPSWEIGKDGKEYFAVDVILWTGYYPEAEKIIGKQHSMELDPSSISGDWKVVGGEYYFVYDTGAFLGLCALGDVFTPCFEESAFYTLGEKNREFFSQFSTNKIDETGGKKMTEEERLAAEKVAFDLAETERLAAEEAAKFAADEAARIAQEEADKIAKDEADKLAQEEADAFAAEELAKETESKNFEEMYAAVVVEVEGLKNQIVALEAEKNELAQYKTVFLTNEKIAILEKFAKKMDEEEIEPFKAALDSYSKEELETKLSIAFANKELSKEDAPEEPKKPNYVATGTKSGLDAIANLIKDSKKK